LVIAALKIKSYVQLRRLIKSNEKVQQDGYVLLKHTGYGPGSWGRYILLPYGDVDDAIIRHEQQHIQLHHSRDMVFISIIQAATWPNPFVHFIKKELVQVHEYQADAAAAIQPAAYATVLLSSVFNTCTLPLTHSFIIHPIKRRIMMLRKNKSASKTRGIIAAVCTLALAGGIITLQSCEQKMDNEKKPEKQHIVTDGAVAFTHKMPEPGYNVSEFLGKHIVYPQEAQDKGIEGRITVKFVVDKDGHIRDIHPAKTDYDPLLADAAVTVVAALPNWVPGEDEKGNKVNVMYTLPITFKLSDDDKKVKS
jgi:TonB family protein